VRPAIVLSSLAAVVAGAGCGSSADDAAVASPSGKGPGAPSAPSSSGGGAGADAGGSLAAAGPALGVWEVEGSDARGTYRGKAELRNDGARVRFLRVVRYDTATVEDGRELWLAWQGEAKVASPDDTVVIEVPLRRRDFLRSRGSLLRNPSEPFTATISGNAKRNAEGFDVRYTGEATSQQERWKLRAAPGAAPLFATDRQLVPTHPPIAPSTRQNLFATYASYHGVPEVKPFVNRPEFQAAQHGAYLDRTDFDFYQAHPKALRVVDKIVDPISLRETGMRALAFGSSLAAKAKAADVAMRTRFLPKAAWLVPDRIEPNGVVEWSQDAALWTGTYVASQVYRYAITGEAEARDNALASLDSVLRLQEITGDWSAFARVLRPAQGSPVAPWHAGTGPNAHLEWKEGGNNDMLKGLVYAYAVAYPAFCGGAGEPSVCPRIRTNVKHLADDVQTSQGTNQVVTTWLHAWLSGDLTYRVKAEGLFTAWKQLADATPEPYQSGTADWSGLHLGFVDHVVRMLVSQRLPLAGGQSTAQILGYIQRDHDVVDEQRLAHWHMLRGAFDAPGLSPALRDDMRWRMREYRYPKIRYDIDRRVNPEFCMSPFPSLPWKADWTTEDRTASLRLYPLFEDEADVYVWKSHFTFRDGGTEVEKVPADYLHAYWFARKYGLITAAE